MVTKADVLSRLPLQNKSKMVVFMQNTDDIINTIITTHQNCETDYDNIYKAFDTGDIYSTCNNLWDFCKYQLVYKAEPDKDQTVRTPARILHDKYVDCKHYSLFIGGVLDAIKANEGGAWSWTYRFGAYNRDDVQHVFVVVKDKGKEIWIDPVLDSFNEHKQPNFYIDEKPMALYSLSGIGDMGGDVTVNKIQAENNFYIVVCNDLFSMKTLMNSNKAVLYGPVKAYMDAQGFDFNHLVRLLNAYEK